MINIIKNYKLKKLFFIGINILFFLFSLKSEDISNYQQLFSQGENLFNEQKYKEAIEIFNKIVDTNNKDQIFMAHYRIGSCYIQLIDYKNAISYFEKGLEIYPDNIILIELILLSYYNLNKLTDLESFGQKKIDEFKNNIKIRTKVIYYFIGTHINDDKYLPTALDLEIEGVNDPFLFYGICGGYAVKNDKEKTKEYLIKSVYYGFNEFETILNEKNIFFLTKSNEWDDFYKILIDKANLFQKLKMYKLNEAISYFKIAENALKEKKYEDALKYYKSSAKIFKEFGENNSYITMLKSIAAIYLTKLFDYNNALEYFKQIINELKNQNKDKATIALYINAIGKIYDNLGKYQEAIDSYNEALYITKELNLKRETGAYLNNLALIYNKLGENDKAMSYFYDALTLAKESNDETTISSILNNLGTMFLSQDNYEKALDNFKEALNIYEKLNKTDYIIIIKSNIAEVYSRIGKYEDAKIKYNEILNIYAETINKPSKAIIYNNLGNISFTQGNYKEALDNFEKAKELNEKMGKIESKAICINNIGEVYKNMGDYNNALDKFKEAYDINKKLDKKESMSINLNNIGSVYDTLGDYKSALDKYKESYNISERLNLKPLMVKKLINISGVLLITGDFKNANINIQKALDIVKDLTGDESIKSICYNSLGNIYSSYGKKDIALQYYKDALKIAENLKDKDSIAVYNHNIGSIYNETQNFTEAENYFNKAINYAEQLNKIQYIIEFKNSLATVYDSQGDYNKAKELYKEALNEAEKRNMQSNIATCSNNLGYIYEKTKDYDNAIKSYFEAMAISEKIGENRDLPLYTANIGNVYYLQGDYYTAIEYLNKSIKLIENSRLSVLRAIKRDYLSNLIGIYKILCSAYIKNNNLDIAFNLSEQFRAKYLKEEIELKMNKDNIKFNDLNDYSKNIDNNTIILNYMMYGINKMYIFIKDKNILTVEQIDENILRNLIETYNLSEKNYTANTKKSNISSLRQNTSKDIDKIVAYYRDLITIEKDNTQDNTVLKNISHDIYKLLIKKAEPYIKGKKNLIIIPDGTLGYLPFETLLDSNNKYLIEKYNINYTYSLTINQLITERQKKYSNNRKPFIGFGDPVYEKDITNIDEATDNSNIIQTANYYIENNMNLREIYRRLKINNWGDLPFSEEMIEEISKIIGKGDIYTKEDVKESFIKKLSEEKNLRNYKVIHFATHGVAISDIPELSTLVLSQFNENKNEDGYLTMNEITNLDIEADFVNLSACESGLGKIYGGEGVVGLGQSFIYAGANSVVVSLWSVNDLATKDFMVEVYKLVKEEKIEYGEAINEVKRKFIDGEIKSPSGGFYYTNPYYWAAFVYYGK